MVSAGEARDHEGVTGAVVPPRFFSFTLLAGEARVHERENVLQVKRGITDETLRFFARTPGKNGTNGFRR